MTGLDAARVERWLAAVSERRSRRSFTGERPDTLVLSELEDVARAFRPFGELSRAVVIRDAPPGLFMGIVGSYGGVSGAPCALAFVGPAEDMRSRAAVGYTGEGLVLEATALGLDTCWVGGLFSGAAAEQLAGVAPDERVFAVAAVGTAAERVTAKERIIFKSGRPRRRKPIEEIAPGFQRWPAWAQRGLEAARIAPSATNRQPWRFFMHEGAVVVSVDGADTPKISKRLDCGIAMLHFELGARAAGCPGRWEFTDAPDVARWVPTG
ncbi:MAG: nitroreductase family protein [Coriobacteriia bacterium]